MSDAHGEHEPVFKTVSFESYITPEQHAEGLYRDTLLFVKGYCDANGVDPGTLLSEQELADALTFEEAQQLSSVSSQVPFGNPKEGYYTANDDGTLLAWGTNPYGEYSKPVILPVKSTPLPTPHSDEEELPYPYDGRPQTITIVGDTFKIRATDEVWQVPRSDDPAEG